MEEAVRVHGPDVTFDQAVPTIKQHLGRGVSKQAFYKHRKDLTLKIPQREGVKKTGKRAASKKWSAKTEPALSTVDVAVATLELQGIVKKVGVEKTMQLIAVIQEHNV